MSEAEKVTSNKVTLMIHGKEREIRFGFSAWAKIEKEYKGLKNLSKMEEDIQNEPFSVIPHLLYIGLVDKEGVTEENILDEYGLNDIQFISETFSKAIYGSLPKDADGKKAIAQTETK